MLRPTCIGRVSALCLAVLLSCGTAAATRDTLDDARLAAVVNGDPFGLKALQVLHRVAARQDADIALDRVLASVIDNRLLGDYALAQYGEAKLFPNSRVGFRREVATEDQLVATLRRAFESQLNRRLEALGGLEQLVRRRHPLDAAALKTHLGRGDALALDYQLPPDRLAALRQVTLLDYRLPGSGDGRVTLFEVWQRQNVQGRAQLFEADAAYAMQQAMQTLANRFVLDWARRDGGLDDSDLTQLSRAIDDRSRRGALLQWMGLEADMHYDSAYLKALAERVTPAEIRDYYQREREEFKRIDKVRARHIRCPDEACAKTASARLAAGEPFAKVAAALSEAPDRERGGNLGWIATGSDGWLEQLAFALPAGKPSRPVRTPQTDGAARWEIVLVEEKVEGFHPLDSETVRYQASQAIARRQALAEFKRLREKLYREADIALNRATLGFGRRELEQEKSR
ncbi:peptidylprolyl isomerase [Chitinimonas lacunae]|uniref:peptidylprolyl isomerase n=1 Tax=Chitinimonas lacunae TaxID=1963018 RepID=A0ABV8MVU4_9NEIS